MATTLKDKSVLIVGGSSGIGFSVAKFALLERVSRVIIASSNRSRVADAKDRLVVAVSKDGLSAQEAASKLEVEVVDAHDIASVKSLVQKVGPIDHLIWTSGDPPRLNWPEIDLAKNKGIGLFSSSIMLVPTHSDLCRCIRCTLLGRSCGRAKCDD